MGKMEIGMIEEICGNVEHFAGKEIRDEVMEGREQTDLRTNKLKTAKWVQGAVSRLDELVDEKTRNKIMENCGYHCSTLNKRVMELAKARRKKYRKTEEFLKAEQRKPMAGTKLVREGNLLYQIYTPQSYTKPMRCYCSLLRGLPKDEKISITYCNCSKGFVKKFWENVLERPVKVELIHSAVSGDIECKFAIYL